jgi:hypothetical protein
MASSGGNLAAARSNQGERLMTLTVFQVGADIENSQILGNAGECDLRKLYARPANGESVAGRPWSSHFTVFDPKAPRANFFYLHDLFLVMDEQAEKVCRPAFGSGELLRFPVAGLNDVYLYNPLLRLGDDAVDWATTKNDLGVYSNLTLIREHIPSRSMFRLPKMSGLYLSSELRDEEGDFLYLYKKHKLSGLYFKKLWDESSGAVPKLATARGMGT